MFLLRLANLIRGYIVISVEGFFLERFLNICTNRNLFLWDIKRLGNTRMIACISIPGFKKIATVAYKSRCHVKIMKRAGLPFLLHKYRKRHAFAMGICLFFCLIFVLSSFVWGIEISGLDKMEESTIRAALERNGLKIGMLTGMVDVRTVQSRMMSELPEIAWIGVNMVGSKALVDVKERAPKPDIVQKGKTYHIKAKYDGVIEKMDIKEGMPLVKPGDVVTKGQLLVSGFLDSKVYGVRYVASDGVIIARTWHEASAAVVPYEEFEKRTGKAKSKHILRVFGVNINFFFNDRIPFEKFERISDVKQFGFGPNLLLPFSFHYDKFYEVEIVRQEISVEQAFQNTLEHLNQQIEQALTEGTEIVNRTQAQKSGENGETVITVTYECLESIAQMEEIMNE